MNKNALQVGVVYVGNPGYFRMVTATGPQFLLYPGQEDHDCLEYVGVTLRGKKMSTPMMAPTWNKSRKSPHHHHSTRSSFAGWAAREATVEELTLVKPLLDQLAAEGA